MSPSPSRRKSIAVTHQVNKPRPAHKRRPHSITPGDSVLKQLSPASRARRSLGPRKSILKSRSSLAPEDADDVTQTMDFTRASINENATRKSLGRRVSFASHAQVRVFEKDPNRGDTSPSGTDHPGQSTQSGPIVNDENDYPGASSMARRRSSLRRSAVFSENGEASMDMDSEPGSSPLPAGFSIQGSFLPDEEADDVSGVWDEEADMDLTTNLAASKPRRSSLGLSTLPQPGQDMSVDDSSRSDDIPHDSTGDLSREESEPTEFTVPLNKSLRKPEPPSAEWLALRAMTHAGDSSFEPPPSDMDEDGPPAQEGGAGLSEEDMDLTEAETRIRRMRESLGLANVSPEDSFTSSEGSSIGGGDNHTINLTNVWRESLGTDSSSVMDLSNFQGNFGESSADEAVNRVFSPKPSLEDPPAPPEQHNSQPVPFEPVLTTPLADVIDSPHDHPHPPVPPVFSKPDFVFSAPKRASLSPSKLKSPASPRKVGTAAFALPVARSQPKKLEATPRVEGDDPFRYEGENSSHSHKRQISQRPPSKPTNAPTFTEPVATTSAAPRSSAAGLRRPSGYFAQRKSLGPSGVLNIPQPTSPEKKAAQRRTSEAGISKTDQHAVNLGRENVGQSISLPYPRPPVEAPSKGANLSGPSESLLPIPPPLFAETDLFPPPEPEALVPQPTVTFADVGAAEQWRNNVQPPNLTEEDEGPPISIEQFFNMTGIRFLDELSAPRRSTILPSQLQSAQRRASLQTKEATLADYAIAMAVDAPQLELYSHVAADLQRWIEHSKEIYHQAEEEAAKVTPMLFREYAMADEQTQVELLQQLKLIKANNHATARSQWYDWRLQWVEQLYAIADQGLSELEQDASTLETIIQQAENVLPSLREEHAQVIRELEQEQSITAEIGNCDQGYLSELKVTLAEQGTALDEFRDEVAEANSKLERLEEKLRDLEIEKAGTTASIEASQRTLHIQKNSTQAEALRLKDELASLEQLHLWHTSKVHADLFEFVYASRFHVHIPCSKFKPLKNQIRITKTKEMLFKLKDQFHRFTDLTIKVAEQRLASSSSIRQIVQGLGDFWLGCAQLYTHFTFLSIKYPVSVDSQPPQGDGDLQGLVATATILLPSVKAKLLVSFILDADTLWAWPMSIGNVDCQIKKAYGPDIDIEKIRNGVLQRMSKSTPDDNHACFLDSCIEATLEYEVVEQ